MAIIFWSESPDNIDWKKLNKEIDFDTEIYFACKNKEEFLALKKKIKNKHIITGAWPILDKKDGYWFSGWTSKENIDKLDEFKDIRIKVDIEPRIYNGNYGFFKTIFWLKKDFINPGRNKEYLLEKINRLDNTSIISGFMLPKIYLKRTGRIGQCRKCYIAYTSVFPKWGRWIIKLYYKFMIKHLGNDNFYAIGLCSHGIFGNEKTYNNKEEFIKDLEFMKKNNVKNIVIYSIEGILKRDWTNIVREYNNSFNRV